MRFLGTGAGEGIPNPFCKCRVCANARMRKGKEIRTRSSLLLDEKTIIDIGADFFAQSFLYDVCFADIEHVLYTHMHDDHINYTMIWERFVSHSGSSKPLNIYIVDEAYKFFTDFYLISPLTLGREDYLGENRINIIRLEFNKSYNIGGRTVTPVRAAHSTSFEANGSSFLIEKDDLCIFYALDSGYFTEEAFDMLKNKRLDILICECTFPSIDAGMNKSSGHMDIQMLIKTLDRLYAENAITADTDIYISHIGSSGMTHEELADYFSSLDKNYKLIAAYDNLEI